jgi:hypothetical protein
MISCTEFIPAYSELFKYLEKKGGKEEVKNFWNYLSDTYLGDLENYVDKYGLKGVWMYYNHTLNEEAADFIMEYDDEIEELRLTTRQCPSKSRLLNLDYMEPYKDYCEHCNVLYRRVLEPRGIECFLDMSECDKARCSELYKYKSKTK